MDPTGGVLKRYWRLVSLVVGIVAAFVLVYALRSALFPFAVGLVLAYLSLPVISWVEKRLPFRGRLQQTKRVTLIIVIYMIFLALVALLSFYLFTSVINAFLILINHAPQ